MLSLSFSLFWMLFILMKGVKWESLGFVFTVDDRNTWGCFQLFDISQWMWNGPAALTSACFWKLERNQPSTDFLLLLSRRPWSWKLQSGRFMVQFRTSRLNTRRGILWCFPLRLCYSPETRVGTERDKAKDSRLSVRFSGAGAGAYTGGVE